MAYASFFRCVAELCAVCSYWHRFLVCVISDYQRFSRRLLLLIGAQFETSLSEILPSRHDIVLIDSSGWLHLRCRLESVPEKTRLSVTQPVFGAYYDQLVSYSILSSVCPVWSVLIINTRIHSGYLPHTCIRCHVGATGADIGGAMQTCDVAGCREVCAACWYACRRQECRTTPEHFGWTRTEIWTVG
jgi:hypothetical protein